MIYSMTGFATIAAELENGSLALEIRAVNHRYLDLQLRVPDELRTLESVLRYLDFLCLAVYILFMDFISYVVRVIG